MGEQHVPVASAPGCTFPLVHFSIISIPFRRICCRRISSETIMHPLDASRDRGASTHTSFQYELP
jgi:hypothetical protein